MLKATFWISCSLNMAILAAGLTIVGIKGAIAELPKQTTHLAQNSPCDGSSNIEINRCLRLRYEESDRRLNQVYRQVQTKLNPAQKQVLTDAQLAWIQFRDKSCDFETYGNRGGSGYRGFLSGCLDRVTRARTTELETWMRSR